MARQGCETLRYGAPASRRARNHGARSNPNDETAPQKRDVGWRVVSAFDDEFGLFSETVVDEPEPIIPEPLSSRAEPRDRAEPLSSRAEPRDKRKRSKSAPRSERPPVNREQRPGTASSDPWAGHRRATELLEFLARKLVQKPECVSVELFIDENAQPVIELIVDPEDLGKVIGRSGRVAHALRTVVRATAEGRVAVDILDSDEAAQDSDASTNSE